MRISNKILLLVLFTEEEIQTIINRLHDCPDDENGICENKELINKIENKSGIKYLYD